MGLSLIAQGSGPIPVGGESVRLDGDVLTIGRGDENDLVLPDPERHVSKRHCVVEQRGDDYVLVDVSTNGTFLNGGAEPVGDIPAVLDTGDVIRMGHYEFRVEIAAAAAPRWDPLAAPAADEEPPGTLDDGPRRLPDDPFDDADDDLMALLGEGKPDTAGGVAPAGGRLPDDFSTGEGSDPFSLDPIPEPDAGPAQRNHAPSTQDSFAPPSPGNVLIPEDWDAEIGDVPASAPPPAPKPADPFSEPEPKPAPSPQPAASPEPEFRRPAPKPAAAGASDDAAREAIRRFLAASGADRVDIPDEELAETMDRVGRAFRVMVEGLREVLMTRAEIKSEFRMNQTMIRSGGNNPLKFSISPEQAMEAMVRPAVPGYQPADDAAREALNDVKAHEVAAMTGMEAALRSLLGRLDPETLAGRIEGRGGLGGILGGRKARYWDAFEEMYGEIAREAEDDFHALFAREFARAYEAQLKKL